MQLCAKIIASEFYKVVVNDVKIGRMIIILS